jgi:hypothetical protein
LESHPPPFFNAENCTICITGETMGEFPDSKKSVGEESRVNETALNEASWQKWISKGKAQDAARRKKFFFALWVFLPALVLLGLWSVTR